MVDEEAIVELVVDPVETDVVVAAELVLVVGSVVDVVLVVGSAEII